MPCDLKYSGLEGELHVRQGNVAVRDVGKQTRTLRANRHPLLARESAATRQTSITGKTAGRTTPSANDAGAIDLRP